ALLLARSIGRPIARITETMSRLAAGEIEVDVPALARRDEVGEMARAVEVFKENAREARRLAALQAEQQAEKERRAGTIAASAAQFDTSGSGFMGAVADAAMRLKQAAESMAGAARAAEDRARSAAAAAEETSSNVQTVAAATEELSSSTAEISRQMVQSSG